MASRDLKDFLAHVRDGYNAVSYTHLRFGLAPLLELASDLKSAWIGLYGDLDKGIPVEQVEALRAAVAATSHPTEVHRYADAEHGFSCDARVAVYNEAAAKDATSKTLRFFAEHVATK